MVVVRAFSFNTREAQADRCEFQDSQGYTAQ